MKIEINTDIIFIKYEYIIIMHIYYYLLSDIIINYNFISDILSEIILNN